MITYDTIVVVDHNILEKVEFYRPFLEKDEFGTFFEDVCFVSDKPADEVPSAGLNGVRNCLFLYGLLGKDEYEKHYSDIEARRIENPNINYYILFCQEKYCACAPSVKSSGSVKKTFGIGILEDDEFGTKEQDSLMREDMRALKLFAMAIAIYTCNKGASTLSFDNYYVTASVELNIRNIYFAIMHKLSGYAEKMNEKKRQIESNELEIEELKKKEPKICEGIFPEDKFEEMLPDLGKFSEYKDMEELRCKMEFEYDKAVKAVKENISKKVDVARKASAVAEDVSLITCKRDEITHEIIITEKSEDFKGYMSARKAGKNAIVPSPDEILKTAETKSVFDSHKIRNLLPLTREFDRSGKGFGGSAFLSALIISVLFVICFGAVYFTRYMKYGLKGVTQTDFNRMLAVPAIFILLAGIITVLVYIVIKLLRKSIVKSVYKAFKEFLGNIPQWCKNVREYINKYLTVYYNYHVKNGRISKLEAEIVSAENEIQKMKEKASSINAVAETVCMLGGKDFETPDISFAKANREYKTVATAIEQRIKEEGKTAVPLKNNSVETPCLWLKKIVYETGNINGGAQ